MPFVGTLPHAFPHRSVGATLVTFGSAPLGYAEDRIMIDERPQWEDIRNDIFGGGAGIPSDIQYLGSVAYVQANLNRFKIANIRQLSNIFDIGNVLDEGKLPDIGSFVRQGNGTTSGFQELILSNVTEKLTFSKAFLRNARKFNLGTRHQQFGLVFECHIASPCDMEMYAVSLAVNPCTGVS